MVSECHKNHQVLHPAVCTTSLPCKTFSRTFLQTVQTHRKLLRAHSLCCSIPELSPAPSSELLPLSTRQTLQVAAAELVLLPTAPSSSGSKTECAEIPVCNEKVIQITQRSHPLLAVIGVKRELKSLSQWGLNFVGWCWRNTTGNWR